MASSQEEDRLNSYKMTCNKVRVRDKSMGRLSGLFEYMRSTNFDAQSLDGLGNGGKMQSQSNLQIDNGGKRSGIRTYPNNIRTTSARATLT